MERRFVWPAVCCLGLALVAIGLVWAFGDYAGISLTAGWAVALGVAATMALGLGLMAVIFHGRRSRRDQAVDRTIQGNPVGRSDPPPGGSSRRGIDRQ